MPKINGNEIRPGNVLEHEGGLWAAIKIDYVKKNLDKHESIDESFLAPINYIKENEKIKKNLKTQNVKIAFYDNKFKNFHLCDYYDLRCEKINLNTKNMVNMDITELNFELGNEEEQQKTMKNVRYLFEKFLL